MELLLMRVGERDLWYIHLPPELNKLLEEFWKQRPSDQMDFISIGGTTFYLLHDKWILAANSPKQLLWKTFTFWFQVHVVWKFRNLKLVFWQYE